MIIIIDEQKMDDLTVKNSWFFGDSFTNGDGCNPEHEYYEKYPPEGNKIWTTLVSDSLNTKENNLGIGGNSNPYIIKQILENLVNFKKGDYVFISSTLPYRLVYPSSNINQIDTLVTDFFLTGTHPDKSKWPNYLDDFIPNLDERKVLLDFISNSFFGKEDMWNEYYNNQYNDIVNFLNTIGINSYFELSPSHWNKHEMIREASNGDIEDNHWSWNGHKTFYKYIMDKVNNKLI